MHCVHARHRHRPRQRRHRRAARCRARTATRAATRSATSRAHVRLNIPTLAALGSVARRHAARTCPCPARRSRPSAAWPSDRAGKDSVTGHWELMGLVHRSRVSHVPQRLSAGLDREFERRIGRPMLGNVVASGTAVIDELGREHIAHRQRRSSTRRPTACFRSPRTRTSCRSPQLYEWCEIAYELAVEGLGLGRVIARPFVGAPGAVHAHRQSPRLRDAAARRDAARQADGGGRSR